MGAASSSASASSAAAGGGCASGAGVGQGGEQQVAARTGPVYNVYAERVDVPSEERQLEEERGFFPGMRRVLWGAAQAPAAGAALDPANNMPSTANQGMAPHQTAKISTARVESTIPKGGTDANWLYPSPQMFYNALVRKSKADDVTPDDMSDVVMVHNAMNEATWQRVLVWESLHREACGDGPRLSRFRGRPDDFSFRARLRQLMGGELPFDRHDWYVDRCGTEVRYIIDFYFNEALAGTDRQFEIDARPALDLDANLPAAVLDRTKMSIYTTFARFGLPCPVSGSPGSIGASAAASALSAGCPAVGASGAPCAASGASSPPAPPPPTAAPAP